MERKYNLRTMDRRDFVRPAGLGLAAGASAAGPPLEAVQDARPGRTALMKVGTQDGDSDETIGPGGSLLSRRGAPWRLGSGQAC